MGRGDDQREGDAPFLSGATATPFFLGVSVGALTEGRLPASPLGSFAAVYLTPWLTPFSLSVGLFALVLFAYLFGIFGPRGNWTREAKAGAWSSRHRYPPDAPALAYDDPRPEPENLRCR